MTTHATHVDCTVFRVTLSHLYRDYAHSFCMIASIAWSTWSTIMLGLCAGGPATSRYTPVRTSAEDHPYPFAPGRSA